MPLHQAHVSERLSLRWLAVTTAFEALADSLARSLLPIVAVAVLGAGTATVGAINSMGLLAFLFLSLPVGVMADRWSAPRRLMTLSSLLRATTMGAGVAAWLSGWLQSSSGIALLLTMAAIVGVADVAYTAGQGLLVPRLVEPDRIRAVFGKVQSVSQTAAAAGPMLLTGLLTVLAAPLAWTASSLLYLASAVTQRRIQETAPEPTFAPRTTLWAQARDGIARLLAEPILARITLANTLNNAAAMAANTLLPVIALRQLGITPAMFAAIGTVGALAGIIGAMLAPKITERIGLPATRIVTACAMTIGVSAVMLIGPITDILPGPPMLWLSIQSAFTGAGTAVAMIAGSDLAPRLVPATALGTVMGAQRAAVVGIMPIAAIAIGTIGATAGITPAAWIWLALSASSVVPCLRLTPPSVSGNETNQLPDKTT